ncbi:MAG: M24 family metallopeptidase [Holosporaceae bacterium]|jgi:Xaa-Pro aminopeptidase|nr:M24 family metallopeptidase [Holosporaceae bacterium]
MQIPFANRETILFKKSSRMLEEGADDIFSKLAGVDFSDGVVIISSKRSAIFVDGRYLLAAKEFVDISKFDIVDLRIDKIIYWMKNNLPFNAIISYDPRYFTHREMEHFSNRLSNLTFSPIDLKRLLNFPPKIFTPEIYQLPKNENKISIALDTIHKNNLDAYLLCDPCSIAWILDLRDLNRKYVPVMLGYLLITRNAEQLFYTDGHYNLPDFRSESELSQDLALYSRIGIDKSQTPYHIKHHNFIDIENPCILSKSIKSPWEIEEIKQAAAKDSAAIINFLDWFYNNPQKMSELDVVEKMSYFRKQQNGFIGESFPTIAAADDHSAIVHYIPTGKTNKIINNILLIDSGAQYRHGTTDITRTLSISKPNDEEKLFYTLVLKGHIAVAKSKFPVGATGAQLDKLARQYLHEYSADYDHSTGHGIGFMSHVHEGPISIASNNEIPLQAGMILSNEPGYYSEKKFGIRLENMMLVKNEGNNILSFEIISLVPFDDSLIDKTLLTESEINWLKEYDQKIASNIN